jgi:RNA-binding protein
MLTSSQRKHLRGLAHHLEPVVRVGQKGVTESVVGETGRALEAHELIKVRLDAEGKEKKELAEALAEAAGAELAGVVGKIAILYRARDEKPKIKLPR